MKKSVRNDAITVLICTMGIILGYTSCEWLMSTNKVFVNTPNHYPNKDKIMNS